MRYYPRLSFVNRAELPVDGGLGTAPFEFGNAAWTQNFLGTPTANAAAGPNGEVTADKLVEDANFQVHYAYQSLGSIDNTIRRVVSCCLKASDRKYGIVGMFNAGFDSGASALIDLDTGAVTATLTTGTATLHGYKVRQLSEGWWRLFVSVNVASSGSGTNYIGVGINTSAAYGIPGNVFNQFQGVTGSGIFAWGARVVVE
jgi:hypothetical protein